MEKEVKTNIIKSAEAVKRKLKQLKDIDYDNDLIWEKVFKPLTNPLKSIAAKNDKLDSNKEYWKDENCDIKIKQDAFGGVSTSNHSMQKDDYNSPKIGQRFDSPNPNSSTESVERDVNTGESSDASFKTFESFQSPRQDSSAWSLSTEVFSDVPYRVRLYRGKTMLGSMRVQIAGDEIFVGEKKYDKSPGLVELLLKKVPDLSLIKPKDLQDYKQLLLETNARRRNFSPRQPIKSNRGMKYLQVIKPLRKIQLNFSTIWFKLPYF